MYIARDFRTYIRKIIENIIYSYTKESGAVFMGIMSKFLNALKLPEADIETEDFSQEFSQQTEVNHNDDSSIANNFLSAQIKAETIIFKNGKLISMKPINSNNWYDARYLISDGISYDLERMEDIRNIKIPNFSTVDTYMDGYGVTGTLDYVMRMKAGAFYNRKEKELCSACLWKSVSLMLANTSTVWSKEDYYRIVFWHNELGMFEEAKKAQAYLSSLDVCTKNQFDLTAESRKNTMFSQAQLLGLDLVAFHDYGRGCCSECAKMTGRVYSISGKSNIFPKLPAYVKEHGNFHPGCRCSMSLFFDPRDTIYYKGNKISAKKTSRRRWVDNRTSTEKELYEKYLLTTEQKRLAFIKRLEYSQIKGESQKEYEEILKILPTIAPKSLNGYIRMKKSKSKNFMKLYQSAIDHGIKIKL